MRLFSNLIAFFVLLSIGLLLHAEDGLRMRGLENRVQKLEQKSPSPALPVTPHAGPRVNRGIDMFLFGELLYWTGRLDTLTYAKTGPLTTIEGLTRRGTDHSVNWQWDPGFKVGVGWNFDHGEWDMLLKYTWFYTKATGNTNETVHPNFAIAFLSQTTAVGAKAEWDLHYQTGDFEFGRNFFVHRYLKLRPFIGVKGTWQKQDQTTRFLDLVFNQTTYLTARTQFNHAIWGLGPRAGMSSAWHFSHWASLYGDFALSGLWLHYNTERRGRLDTAENQLTIFPLRKKLRITKPIIELGLGLRFESYFGCRRLHLLFQFGWETQIWTNQTLYIDLNDTLKRFDLLLHGGVAKLRFDF
ncbi:MAG: Lpg1974 family pore-forming outer membrane protein [Chlamydiota bacterium]